MFYHKVKEHMSPSALSQWLGGRGQFVRSYFAGEKSGETAAMRAGTEIHALVEAGVIEAQHVFGHGEEELRLPVPGTEFFFMGRPDDYSDVEDDAVSFVDYKSGKANNWAEKLPTDIKMRATAWLVWQKSGKPSLVRGYIEFIQTTWDADQRKVVPLDGKETEVVGIEYTAEELEAFTAVIAKAMTEVNTFYEKWKGSSGEFVRGVDVERSVEIRRNLEALEAELDEVEGRILSQMEFGGEEQHPTEFGTYFIKTTNTYEFPKELAFKLDGAEDFTLDKAERVASGLKAAKANFELANEPKEVKRSVQFRAKKEKKSHD